MSSDEPIRISAALSDIRERLQRDAVLKASVDARIAELDREKAEAESKRRATEHERSGIPRRLVKMIASLDDTEAIGAVKAWLKNGKTFLLLAGGVGVGKTVAAAFSVAQFPGSIEVAPGLFRPANPGLFRKARDVATLSQFDGESWERLYRTPLLAIDDLGTEPLDEKGWALSAILGLLDRRYDDSARTVVTTNLGMESMRQRYGQDGGRLFDRLREAADWVELAGESLRERTP